MFWLHIHTNKSSTKFQVDWTSSGSTVKCSKVGVLWTLPKTLSPPNDTPIFCKFLHNNTTESSEIWGHWSYWLIESYCVVFMRKTYSLELKIEFNDFTISLRGGWLYLFRSKFEGACCLSPGLWPAPCSSAMFTKECTSGKWHIALLSLLALVWLTHVLCCLMSGLGLTNDVWARQIQT